MDVYPGAPGQSGYTSNLSGVLGIGAYSIPQANGGSAGAGNFGQMITENFVRSFISTTAMNMGAGDGSLGDIVSNLTDYLSQLELSSLKWLQPFIPGATDEDFSTTSGAVAKIIDALNLQLLMGANEFQDWIDDIFSGLQTAFNQVVDIFNNVVVVPINASIQAIKDWWVSYTTQNPLWNQIVTWFNQLLTSLGISTGTGAGTAVGSQIFTAGATANGAAANANQQLAWWQRLPENILITLDGLHVFYPLGSPSDTATTTVGGKRTWYAAQADTKALYNSVTGASPSSTVFTDVGSATQAAAASASLASSNAAAAAAANQDLTNKIIKSGTGVEPTAGTTSDAYDALTNFPASNIAGNAGALVTWGATGTTGGSSSSPVTSSHTPDAKDTSVDILVAGRYAANGSQPALTVKYGTVTADLVNNAVGNAYGGSCPYLSVYRVALTPQSSPPTTTITVTGSGGVCVSSLSYYGIKVSYSTVMNGNLAGSNANNIISLTRNSDNTKRIILAATWTANSSTFAPNSLTSGAVQRVSSTNIQNYASLYAADIAGVAAPGSTTLSVNVQASAGYQGSWAAVFIEMSN